MSASTCGDAMGYTAHSPMPEPTDPAPATPPLPADPPPSPVEDPPNEPAQPFQDPPIANTR